MIEIHIQTKNNTIVRLDIQGHAGYKPHGEDLVCAGVSSIAIGLLNALSELDGKCRCSMEENHIRVVVDDIKNTQTQIILQTGVIQLKTIQESYDAFIKMKKQEV